MLTKNYTLPNILYLEKEMIEVKSPKKNFIKRKTV